jgi:hypothetical protein
MYIYICRCLPCRYIHTLTHRTFTYERRTQPPIHNQRGIVTAVAMNNETNLRCSTPCLSLSILWRKLETKSRSPSCKDKHALNGEERSCFPRLGAGIVGSVRCVSVSFVYIISAAAKCNDRVVLSLSIYIYI